MPALLNTQGALCRANDLHGAVLAALSLDEAVHAADAEQVAFLVALTKCDVTPERLGRQLDLAGDRGRALASEASARLRTDRDFRDLFYRTLKSARS